MRREPEIIDEPEYFKVEKEGCGPILEDTKVIACAIDKNGVVGFPHNKDSVKVKFRPNRFKPVMFVSAKISCGFIRTTNVQSFDVEEDGFTIRTKNSTYKMKRV